MSFSGAMESLSQDLNAVKISEEANPIDEIDKKLFLGDKNAATDLELLTRLDLSHILTAELIPLPRLVSSTFPNLAIMQVALPDMPDADMLSEFEAASNFIQEGIDSKGILVHCYHGVSRSATLVVAYLMKTRRLGYLAALDLVRAKRTCVEPNEGFQRQLLLYERMGYKLDPQFKPFKLYKLTGVHNYVKQAKVLPSQVRAYHSEENDLTSVGTSDGRKLVVTAYKCKKCRLVIGTSRNVLPHAPKQQITWHSLLEDQVLNLKDKNFFECRQGVFMEPMPSTMSKVCQISTDSKMNCRKCDYKLGSFSWDGPVSCACGGSVAPGFLLNLSRVDKCTMKKEIEAVI